jgi:hypothetical protein
MPDKPIEPGSITQTADSQNERISEVSSVANTVNEMQREVDTRLTEVEQMAGDTEAIGEVQAATVGILHKMKETMGSFAQGINAITLGTATATKDAIAQYGKAISEDISYNKQSVVAMALSRSTPIFGYFAAKFMETDVFQKAKAKMAESVKGVFSGIGKTIGGFIKGRKEGEEEVPKVQRGGYVKKGGLVEVHAGEIVAPIEKVLSRVDESIGAVKQIGVSFKKAQLRSMANLAGYVKGQEQLGKVGIFKGFLRAMNQVQTQYEEPAQIRMLRAILSIQDTLGATMGTWQQVWTKMLVEHPTFRNIMFSLRGLSSAFTFPGKIAYSVFKARGGYKSQLPNAKNPFENISLILGLLYAESMHRLDNIVLNTRHTAWATRDLSTYVTGKTYPPLIGTQKTLWSIMGVARKMLNVGIKWMPAVIAGGIDIMFGGSGKSGWKSGKSVGEFFSKERKLWGSALVNSLMDMTAGGKMKKSLYGELPDTDTIKEQLPETTDDAPIPVRIVSQGKELKKIEDKKWRSEQKGESDLLSGVNNLYAANVKQHKRSFKVQKATAKDLDQMNKRGKMKTFMDLIMKGLGAAGSLISGLVSSLIGPLMGFLGLKSGAFKFLTSGATFAKFIGPVAGVLVAAGLGVAIGTWLNTYIGPWLNKKWDQMYAENRKAAKTVLEKTQAESKIARETEGVAGLQARYKTALTAGLREGQKVHGMDPKLAMIKQGQQEFFDENISSYLKYPVDMIAPWRKAWASDPLGYGGAGRFQVFGWGQDPVKYGRKREEQFLEWLNANKTELTPAQMAAQEKEWTKKVRGAKGMTVATMTDAAKRALAAAKAKGIQLYDQAGNLITDTSEYAKTKGAKFYDKAGNVITDVTSIAKDYAADAGAKAAGAATAMSKYADQTGKAIKDMGKNFSETVGSQSTTLVNTITDSSQKIVNTGGRAGANLYQDLKKTVITGKVDMDTLELFWD